MGGKRLTTDRLRESLEALQIARGKGEVAAELLGVSERTMRRHKRKIHEITDHTDLTTHDIKYAPQIGNAPGSPRWELKSLKDNTYRFAGFGDLHAASKYCRWDVREDLTRRAERFEAQCIFDTGNWIDGQNVFNIHDVEVLGLENQLRLLSLNYPKTKLMTYAISGHDHEGWYAKKSGINVGQDCERVMRAAGHQWTDLGYIEADVVLRNANSGKTAICRIAHPGKGTAYSVSYRPQKIVESYEGGEKPAILLIGHYHKVDMGLIRNVWYGQTGCAQDQTPFMRLIPTEAQVGGLLIECEQDPRTGAIIEFTVTAKRYFNKAYYFEEGRGNNRWSCHGPITQVPRS